MMKTYLASIENPTKEDEEKKSERSSQPIDLNSNYKNKYMLVFFNFWNMISYRRFIEF